MTTMNSDSESQDSDEGRRFRFEATRKVANDSIDEKKRKSTSFKSHDYDRRSRSRDRSSRHERKDERSSHERMRRDGTSSRDDSRRRRDDEFTRYRDRDVRNIHKDTRDCLSRHDSKSRDRKESKNRDEKSQLLRHRSREKSYDKIRHDFKHRDKREKYHSHEKSCQRGKLRDDNCPTIVNKSEKKEVVADNQDCKELNLSDFDIVSDTDGDSDASDIRNQFSNIKTNRRICDTTRNNILDEGEKKVKNRRNGNKSPRPSNSNNDAHAFSDFLLGNASTSAPTTCNYNISDNKKKHSNKLHTKANDCADVTKDDENVDNNEDVSDDINADGNDDEFSYGSILPPSLKEDSPKRIDETAVQLKIIGPSLPNEYRKYIVENINIDNENDHEKEDIFGPALPPHLQNLQKSEKTKIIGPIIPDNNADQTDSKNIVNEKEISDIDDFDTMGPLPIDHPGIENDRIQQELEYRARLIKEELAEMDHYEEKKREEWMTELPAVQTANLGLSARKFRSRPGPDMSNRSDWTDTPSDRARKQKELQMGKRPRESEPVVEVRVEKSRSRHEKSLMELHQKKMNKRKKKDEKAAKEAGKTIRRPFDRDVDLQVNRFDNARKKRMMMSATTLDDRFSRGNI